MARADYCGNGQSHTVNGRLIDYSDSFGVATPTTVATREWDPNKASLESAWGPDGATCMARTRDGWDVTPILRECPGRFEAGAVDLGQGGPVGRPARGPEGPGHGEPAAEPLPAPPPAEGDSPARLTGL